MQTALFTIEGTLIAELLEQDPKNYKSDVSDHPEPKPRDVLGVLTGFEKACIMLKEKKEQEHDEMHEIDHGMNINNKHVAVHLEIEALKEMLWGSIHFRIPRREKDDKMSIRGEQIIGSKFTEAERFQRELEQAGFHILGLGVRM